MLWRDARTIKTGVINALRKGWHIQANLLRADFDREIPFGCDAHHDRVGGIFDEALRYGGQPGRLYEPPVDKLRVISSFMTEAQRLRVRRGALSSLRTSNPSLIGSGKGTMRESVVAKARISMKLSQSQFAELLGVSVRTLQQWEQGRREPTGAAQTLIKVAIHEPKALRKAVAA